jgi:hypothetical protein
MTAKAQENNNEVFIFFSTKNTKRKWKGEMKVKEEKKRGKKRTLSFKSIYLKKKKKRKKKRVSDELIPLKRSQMNGFLFLYMIYTLKSIALSNSDMPQVHKKAI